MPKNKSINLLPQEEFEESTLGRILHWAMGSFRIIVIITEMVVMGAFLSRFWLDAKNSDYSDSIKIASSQIQVQSEFEKEFRGVQTKINIFSKITSGPKASDRIQVVAGKTPTGIKLSSITIRDISAEIKGEADGEANVAQFISNLKSRPEIKKIDLESLNSSENNPALIAFQITVSY